MVRLIAVGMMAMLSWPTLAPGAETSQRVLALALIAHAQAKAGDIPGARATLARAVEAGRPLELHTLGRSALAAAPARVGDVSAARTLAGAGQLPEGTAYGLARVALAQADAGDRPDAAATAEMALVGATPAGPNAGNRAGVVVVWAVARSGDFDGALLLATQLEARKDERARHWEYVKDRPDALALVAYEQARAGLRAEALATADMISEIDLPATANFHATALAYVARGLAERGDLAGALAVAESIPAEARWQEFLFYNLPLATGLSYLDLGELSHAMQFVIEAMQTPRTAAFSSIAWAQNRDVDGALAAIDRAVPDLETFVQASGGGFYYEIPFGPVAAVLGRAGAAERAPALAEATDGPIRRAAMLALVAVGQAAGGDIDGIKPTVRRLTALAGSIGDADARAAVLVATAVAQSAAGENDAAYAIARRQGDRNWVDGTVLGIVAARLFFGDIGGAQAALEAVPATHE